VTKINISGQGRIARIRNVQSIGIFSVLEFVMSKIWTRVALRGIVVALLAIGLQADSFAGVNNGLGMFVPGNDEPRLATYDQAGETHFALSVPSKANPNARASDIVIYIDTSASQSGAFKRDSIEAVKSLTQNLSADDRIQIVAVDLDPIPLTQGFVAPGSNDVIVALEKLKERVPLGSTDMEAMLSSASKSFAQTDVRNKNVVYIGDGISRGSLLQTEVFAKLVTTLADSEIAVSSFAIGPDRNIELMAALANNTGGMLFVDTNKEDSVSGSAAGLAKAMHASVFWPKDGKLDESVVDMFPRRFPPIRTDRDTIVLGTLSDREAVSLQITGVIDGQRQELSWSLNPEASDETFAFLPGMVTDARKDNGISLPTLGSVGLKEFVRARSAEADQLSDLGDRALAVGDLETAKTLGQNALKLSAKPASTKAYLNAMASTYKVQEDDPFGISGDNGAAPGGQSVDDPFGAPPAPTTPVQDGGGADPFGVQPEPQPQIEAQPAQQPDVFGGIEETPMEDNNSIEQLPVEPGQEQPGFVETTPQPTIQQPDNGGINMVDPTFNNQQDEIQRLLGGRNTDDEVLYTEEERIRIVNERARQQVIVEQKLARDEARLNPDLAIDRIKNVMQVIDQTADLFPGTRADLRETLESVLLSFRRQKLAFDERVALRDLNISSGIAIASANRLRDRREEKIVRLVDQFNTLFDEGNYEESVEVAETLYTLAPEEPAAIVGVERAHFARNVARITELRRQKALNFQEAMYEIEKTTIPFPGNEILIFPDKEEWDRKVLRRDKYKNLRLTGSPKEEQILSALDEEVNLNYDEAPWSDVAEKLQKDYGINIVLTSSASDDSLTEDEPITVNLTGIRLKNALRIMLEQKNATFVVQDEVLKIISLDDAEDIRWFVTNVYNVGDLVAPRQGIPSGGGGGGGFGGGGQQGGGFGGGGGGFGGGGQQGGGGGVFCVQESKINVQYKGADETSKAAPRKAPKLINLTDYNPTIAWPDYFAKTFADPADVRYTARKLMKANKPSEVVSMIYGAIKNDQLQPWMYEGLVLAMQVAGQPQSEVERALMSAVDISDDEQDVLYAGTYMAKNGMEKRAIRLLKGFARANPTRTEPFVVGLQAAQKIKDIEGIKWATAGVFSQEWPDHPEVVKQAKYAAEAVKSSLAQAGQTEELAAFDAALKAAEERDCYIRVSWTGDADLDLYIEEPGGTVCSRLLKRTTAGGISLGDKFTAKKGLSGEVAEEYILPKGFSGDYRLIIKRVWGNVTSGKVTVAIHNHYKSEREASMTKQVKIDNEGAIVLFALDQGRRTEPLEDHAIRTVVRRQMAVNRHLLAQQLDDGYSSGAASEYYGGLLSGAQQGGAAAGAAGLANAGIGGLRPGAVGYQPIITNIQEGIVFNVNHATTADRLHVLVSVSPNFSQISEVATFNILGDAQTAQGLAQGGGGGGGAGGGIGGGVAGGGGGAGGGGAF